MAESKLIYEEIYCTNCEFCTIYPNDWLNKEDKCPQCCEHALEVR